MLNTRRMLTEFGIEMVSADDIGDMQPEDYIITVDAQALNANRTDFIGNEVACIDHHPVFNEYAYKYSDIRRVGACSSLIAEYYYKAGIIPDTATATALVYGIKVDTGEFGRGVTQLDVDMFSFIFKYADADKLGRLYANSMAFDDLEAYGAAIESAQVFGRVGFSHLPFACTDAMIGILSDFLLSLDVVDISIIYSVREDGYKLSVRSEYPEVNAGKLVYSALSGIGSGGGHASMAGGFIPIKNIPLLGEDTQTALKMRFISEIEKIAPEEL